MDQFSDKKLSWQIAGLQGFYWMMFCPIASFASVYLLSKDFTNQNIGWVLAIANILAVVLQPALGTWIDRMTNLTLKIVISTLTLFCMVLLAGLIVLNLNFYWTAIFYIFILAFLITMQPLINALTFEFINAGHKVNFGLTRAMGSVSFAVLSTFLGFWVLRFSVQILPIITLILFVAFLLLLLSFPKARNLVQEIPLKEIQTEPGNKVPEVGFLRKYERFIPFMIGIACLFIFHTIINNFLPQIVTSHGGKDSDFGISLTIAALAEVPAFLGFSFLISRFSTQSMLKFSGVFYALRSFVFLIATSVWMINLGQGLQALSFAVFIPASVYYVNMVTEKNDKVKGQTFITGFITLGSFFGNVIGGWLLDLSGVTAMLFFGAVGAVAGCLLLIYSVRAVKRSAA